MPLKSFGTKFPLVSPRAFVAADAMVIGDVEIGDEASIWFGAILRGDVNFIRIGARTNVQDAAVIHVSSHEHPTILGNEITVGHRVTLHGCHIESGSLIGIGSIILDGARVGANCLVAAGSLITPRTLIPANSLVMGSPARVKRPVTAAEIDHLRRSWQNYVELSSQYRRQM